MWNSHKNRLVFIFHIVCSESQQIKYTTIKNISNKKPYAMKKSRRIYASHR
jgi:hypothetical protein